MPSASIFQSGHEAGGGCELAGGALLGFASKLKEFLRAPPSRVWRPHYRFVFHPIPKHPSWLDLAEIKIDILDRQCLDRRLPDGAPLVAEVDAWQQRRHTEQRAIACSFTRQDAHKSRA